VDDRLTLLPISLFALAWMKAAVLGVARDAVWDATHAFLDHVR
jgi:hypothetical protein